MNIKRYKNQFHFLIHLFLIFKLIKQTINSCDRETPILLNNGSCVSLYCTNEQFISGECKKDNEIIKNQWLNNIILIGVENCYYANFAEFSNGDMVILTEDTSCSATRYFYGLKNNGRPFFNTSNNEESEFFSINSQSSCSVEHDRDVFTIKTNLTQEEYVLNIQKKDVGYVELFDFQNNKVYSKLSQELLGNALYNYRGTYINNLNENDNEFYFIYGSLIYKNPTRLNDFKFLLQKIIFNTKESLENDSDCLKNLHHYLKLIQIW